MADVLAKFSVPSEEDGDVAELAAYTAKHKARADEPETSKKPARGRTAAPPRDDICADGQVNLGSPDSRAMPLAAAGFERHYNAQVAVDAETLMVVATGLTQASSDKQQAELMPSNALHECRGLGDAW